MPHRPFTRAQALQNAAFLRALARTGNARLAAAQLGVHRATYTKRRAHNRRFATLWDAALAFAAAQINETQNQPRSSRAKSRGAGTDSSHTPFDFAQDERKLTSAEPNRPRTKGGEPVPVRLANGRVQLRRAKSGRMTKAAEQAFLAALSATCNVRLAAVAAGFTHSAFYQRAKRDPGFRREWRLARAEGHQRLELALLEGFQPESHEDDAWRHNDPPPIPPMTPQMAIQLLAMHRKRVDHGDLPDPMRRRRWETREAVSMRLGLMYQAGIERDREAWRLAEAARNERRDRRRAAEEGEGIAPLPQLGVVDGWSKADPAKKAHDPEKAMFGGWRIKDWEKQKR
jgi:hypothetical protein